MLTKSPARYVKDRCRWMGQKERSQRRERIKSELKQKIEYERRRAVFQLLFGTPQLCQVCGSALLFDYQSLHIYHDDPACRAWGSPFLRGQCLSEQLASGELDASVAN